MCCPSAPLRCPLPFFGTCDLAPGQLVGPCLGAACSSSTSSSSACAPLLVGTGSPKCLLKSAIIELVLPTILVGCPNGWCLKLSAHTAPLCVCVPVQLIESFDRPVVVAHARGHVIPALPAEDVQRVRAFLQAQQQGAHL